MDRINSPCNLERRVFPGGGGVFNQDTVTAYHETMSKVSTIESPCSDQLSDYLVNSSSEDQEFSTDVSSTRKRRR